MTITLETLYTPWTLDSYNTFGPQFDNEEEYILEALSEEHNKEVTYDDVNWEHNMGQYLSDLAVNLVHMLKENITDDVIKDVTSDCKVVSPREYNFITDHIFIDFDVDVQRLTAWIDKRRAAYEEDKIQSRDGFIWCGDEHATMLAYYLQQVSAQHLTPFDYLTEQFEMVDAYEYIEYSYPQ